jgi:hypothetical protein
VNSDRAEITFFRASSRRCTAVLTVSPPARRGETFMFSTWTSSPAAARELGETHHHFVTLGFSEGLRMCGRRDAHKPD